MYRNLLEVKRGVRANPLEPPLPTGLDCLLCTHTLTFSYGLDFYSINMLICHLYFDFFLLGRVRSESSNLAGVNLVGTNEDPCNLYLCVYACREKCEDT